MKINDVLKTLDDATLDDLAAIQAEEEATARRLEALRSLARLMSVRVHGPPPPKSKNARTAKQSPVNGAGDAETITEERQRRVVKFLHGNKGPCSIDQILKSLRGNRVGFHWVLRSPWFKTAGEYVELTEAGKAAAASLPA